MFRMARVGGVNIHILYKIASEMRLRGGKYLISAGAVRSSAVISSKYRHSWQVHCT